MQDESPTTRRKRKYTEDQRASALADVLELGVTGAAAKHDIPLSTLSLWNTKLRKSESQSPQVRATEHRASDEVECVAETEIDQSTTSHSKTVDDSGAADAPAPKRNIVKRYTPSQRAEAVELSHSKGVVEASKVLGISRFSLYQWRKKARVAAAGEGEVITSGESQSDIEAQRDLEILNEYKSHPGLGPSQVRNQLRRKNIKVSVHTVRRVMESAGYRPPKVEQRPHDRRYEAVRPNHLWHLDFVQRFINRTSTFTLILLDDRSRFVVGHGVDDAERADMVIQTFEQAVTLHGKPESVMHDRGSAFWAWRGISRFSKLLAELGVDQIVAEDKEHNGNIAKELFNQHRFYDLAEMKRRLKTHLHWYNHGRTHHAHGGLLVPADHYYGRADEVMARIEAGAAQEHDELGLRDRRLSLFSVTSENGEVLISLMGQQIKLGGTSKG